MKTKVKEPCFNFEMFTPEGNRKCNKLVKKISKKILKSKNFYSNEDIIHWIFRGMLKISNIYGEVWETKPRNHIVDLINKVVQKRYGSGENLDNYRWVLSITPKKDYI